MSTEPIPTPFLNPQALLSSSRVAGIRVPTWPLLVLGIMFLFLLSSSSQEPFVRILQFSTLPMLLLMSIGLTVFRVRLARRAAAESEAVAALDELVQLRRWPEAANVAHRILSQPMLMPDRRLFALMGLASLLSRYHRFADARLVHDALLNPEPGEPIIDPTLAHSVKVARAMSLLREDHLVDADRAMSDLRREVNQARDEIRKEEGVEKSRKVQSAGVVLLDLYRDVKTGHPQETVDGFNKAMPALRDQLGIRVADAWVLVAAAHHVLRQVGEAERAYQNATTLVPAVELHRRYPETKFLSDIFTPVAWPNA
jgi:hypothetical protein